MAHFIPTTEKMSVEGLAVLFRDHVWKLHGLPESIISDRGAQFVAGLMKELNGMLEIEIKLLTAFHPQTDGQTEQANQELEQYLRMFVDYHQKQWLDWLGTAEFAYNNKVNSSTKVLPFMANNGRNPRMGFEMRKKGKVLKAEEFAVKMKEIQEEAQAALRKAQEEMKRQADWHKGEAEEYKVGDMVLLSTRDLKWQMIGRRTDKLTERFVGPYRVKGIVSSNAIELDLPSSVRIHPVVNVSRICRYRDQVKGQKVTLLPPVEIQGEMEYKVEKILSKRKRYGQVEYLVRWKGYTAEKDTWKKEGNLGNAREAVEEYEREYERTARRIREEEDRSYKRSELPGRYTAKVLYGWDDRMMGDLRRSIWKSWKGTGENRKVENSSGGRILKGGGVMS